MAKKKKPKQKWTKESYKLPENHGWSSKPGYSIFVADRGAVRFDYPRSWVIKPTESGSIRFHDRKPPKDDCVLEMSVMRVHPAVDLTDVPLRQLALDCLKHDRRPLRWCGEVFEIERGKLAVAWSQGDYEDAEEDNRPARTRWLLARAENVVPFITMDYWLDDAGRFEPVWDEVLATLRVADYDIQMIGSDPRYWAMPAKLPKPGREAGN